MNEYYILTHDSDIIGVFQTLESCLTWKPKKELLGALLILRVRQPEEGICKIQTIPISNSVYGKIEAE